MHDYFRKIERIIRMKRDHEARDPTILPSLISGAKHFGIVLRLHLLPPSIKPEWDRETAFVIAFRIGRKHGRATSAIPITGPGKCLLRW